MADNTIDQRLDRIEASLATLRSETATKTDITALRGEMASFAKGADIRLLQRRVEQELTETRALRADVRLLTGLMNSVATSVQALIDHQMQLADRVGALETPTPETP